MIMLRDFGIVSVHFAGLPPGTAALMIKFLPPETVAQFGGPEKLAEAIDESLNRLADVMKSDGALSELILKAA